MAMAKERTVIDIGVNLSAPAFAGRSGQILQEARGAGVTAVLCTGTSVEASQTALALAREYPGYVYATAGVHPHHASKLDTGAVKALRELLFCPEVVAVGECGLDYNRNFSTPHQQRIAFSAQLQIAAETGKPLFLHERDAHEDFVDLIKSMSGQVRGVVHCFTGGPDAARTYLDMGLDIGVTGWVADERRNADLLAAIPFIPLDRLHLETDAPYLVPRNMPRPRPSTNRPAYLAWVAESVSTVTGHSVEQVRTACQANSERLFGLKTDQ